MGQLTVDSGQLTAEEQVEVALMKVQFDLVHREAKRLEGQCGDLIAAYHALQDVCRSVARCEGKSAAEWRDVAVAEQAALVETTATMNRYHGDWEKAVALVSDLQAQVTEFTGAPESVRVDGEKKGRLVAEERVLQLTMDNEQLTTKLTRAEEHGGVLLAELEAVRGLLKSNAAESSRTIAHLKDQWVEARELLSSNFANERAGLHEQLAELRAQVAQLTMDNGFACGERAALTTKESGVAELLARVEVDVRLVVWYEL